MGLTTGRAPRAAERRLRRGPREVEPPAAGAGTPEAGRATRTAAGRAGSRSVAAAAARRAREPPPSSRARRAMPLRPAVARAGLARAAHPARAHAARPDAALLAARRRGGRPRSPSRCCRASAGSRPRWRSVGWLASPDADREGTALVLAAAAAPVPLLLPRAGHALVAAGARAAARRDRARPRLRRARRLVPPRPRCAHRRPARRAGARRRRRLARRAGLGAAGFLWLARRGHGDRCCSASPTARCARASWEGSSTAPPPTRCSRC